MSYTHHIKSNKTSSQVGNKVDRPLSVTTPTPYANDERCVIDIGETATVYNLSTMKTPIGIIWDRQIHHMVGDALCTQTRDSDGVTYVIAPSKRKSKETETDTITCLYPRQSNRHRVPYCNALNNRIDPQRTKLSLRSGRHGMGARGKIYTHHQVTLSSSNTAYGESLVILSNPRIMPPTTDSGHKLGYGRTPDDACTHSTGYSTDHETCVGRGISPL